MRRTISRRQWAIGLVSVTASVGMLQAGEIYKSVDADGHVVYSDRADPSRSQTPVVLPDDPAYPPPVLHVCGTQNCFTLLLDHGSYRRADGTDDTWTVGTFTASSVVLRRRGAPTGNTELTVAGSVANDRLVGVTVNGAPMGGLDAAWGAALNTLPGSNAERDAGLSTGATDDVSTAATPPPLPYEDQPPVPESGFLWTPGYWAWQGPGYVWVAGTWVRPPQAGLLWTPAFWAIAGTLFVFHHGYWGPFVGYYGGVNYGHGYFGSGYTGGRWVGGAFAYNSSVNHLSPAIKNSYAAPPPSSAFRPTPSYSAANRSLGNASSAVRPTGVGTPGSAIGPRSASARPAAMERRSVPAATVTFTPATNPRPAQVSPTVAASPKPARPRTVRATPRP